MAEDPLPASEAQRLEALWRGQFGDDYVDRNDEFDHRSAFWAERMQGLECNRVLEVGCNVGGNLQWIAEAVPPRRVYGVDINEKALAQLIRRVPGVNACWSPARELPFRDGWFDLVFTVGVLIHQPDDTLPLVMAEMVRCSRRWILFGEYHDTKSVAVPYRGHEGALFRRDYGGLFQQLFPDLRLRDEGFVGRDEGWDDVTWWLFEKP
jgi:pseudaminic acid biosynthesis-associated methylase